MTMFGLVWTWFRQKKRAEKHPFTLKKKALFDKIPLGNTLWFYFHFHFYFIMVYISQVISRWLNTENKLKRI